VLLVDIDHFKQVNDTYGHGVGDVVLHEDRAAHAIRLRDYETIGRYGGEEFLIVLSKADLAVSRQVGERIRPSSAALQSSMATRRWT
jgi:diguanylate cyclase (GGDEF)-like protein